MDKDKAEQPPQEGGETKTDTPGKKGYLRRIFNRTGQGAAYGTGIGFGTICLGVAIFGLSGGGALLPVFLSSMALFGGMGAMLGFGVGGIEAVHQLKKDKDESVKLLADAREPDPKDDPDFSEYKEFKEWREQQRIQELRAEQERRGGPSPYS